MAKPIREIRVHLIHRENQPDSVMLEAVEEGVTASTAEDAARLPELPYLLPRERVRSAVLGDKSDRDERVAGLLAAIAFCQRYRPENQPFRPEDCEGLLGFGDIGPTSWRGVVTRIVGSSKSATEIVDATVPKSFRFKDGVTIEFVPDDKERAHRCLWVAAGASQTERGPARRSGGRPVDVLPSLITRSTAMVAIVGQNLATWLDAPPNFRDLVAEVKSLLARGEPDTKRVELYFVLQDPRALGAAHPEAAAAQQGSALRLKELGSLLPDAERGRIHVAIHPMSVLSMIVTDWHHPSTCKLVFYPKTGRGSGVPERRPYDATDDPTLRGDFYDMIKQCQNGEAGAVLTTLDELLGVLTSLSTNVTGP